MESPFTFQLALRQILERNASKFVAVTDSQVSNQKCDGEQGPNSYQKQDVFMHLSCFCLICLYMHCLITHFTLMVNMETEDASSSQLQRQTR